MKANNWTQEFELLYNHCIATFAPTLIEPFFYQGATGGSEFLTYNAKKIYIGASTIFINDTGVGTATAPYAILYNELNAIAFGIENASGLWNTTSATINYVPNNAILLNTYFSRITIPSSIRYIKFIGYRLTLP